MGKKEKKEKKEQQETQENQENKEQLEQRNMRVFFLIVAMGLLMMAWLWMDRPSQAELTVIAHARENRLSSSAYPAELIALLESNPETKDFVLNYPFREEVQTDLTSYDISQGIPLLMQWDQRWGYQSYGGGMVAATGCGPLCLAMAGYYVTQDEKFYPERIVEFAIEKEYYSKTDLITQGAPELGLQVKEIPVVEDKLATYLQAGNPVIAAVGPGDFTSTSHLIVLAGYQDGQLTVNDPDSYLNSGKAWSFEEIKAQITNLWVISAAEAA